ncbi:aspartate--tRNA ligase [Elysia marginata]|uniref:Aspartate--tRNA ligase n=1 Tax=Elysia marginata TaxID=1093978 RepID=A0AAV4G9G0_9GAST|nr:aspartate--tRNA ligase [Elysia marginata]
MNEIRERKLRIVKVDCLVVVVVVVVVVVFVVVVVVVVVAAAVIVVVVVVVVVVVAVVVPVVVVAVLLVVVVVVVSMVVVIAVVVVVVLVVGVVIRVLTGKVKEGGLFGAGLGRVFDSSCQQRLGEELDLSPGDLVLVAGGAELKPHTVLGHLRVAFANQLETKGVNVRSDGFSFVWVDNFPLFLPREDGGKGGTEFEDCTQLEHLLEALDSGCPPHGGIALGLDRLIAIMTKTDTIRDVIAFPKITGGKDPLSNAPAPVNQSDLEYYNILVQEDTKDHSGSS